ncbi:MAG: GHKL domain-containing protein, partial [Firmicutes bacterium]|nr:GHKL domain-containing protein [Bacillota bacterium]
VTILADGRRMQRVFDNLMNNICKYSQPGTRVWLTLEREGDDAVISFKNTSKEPLDMTEEELLERFTRGDHSRNTEGSGLGLSIAKSLTELQKGSFRLSVDGDLFKAVLSFPLI